MCASFWKLLFSSSTSQDKPEDSTATAPPALQALLKCQEADLCAQSEDYAAALSKYEEALRIIQVLPASEPFDRNAFGASCSAIMGFACAKIGKVAKGLQYTDVALNFFERVGEMYPVEHGRWVLSHLTVCMACLHDNDLQDARMVMRRVQVLMQHTHAQTTAFESWRPLIEATIARCSAQTDV